MHFVDVFDAGATAPPRHHVALRDDARAVYAPRALRPAPPATTYLLRGAAAAAAAPGERLLSAARDGLVAAPLVALRRAIVLAAPPARTSATRAAGAAKKKRARAADDEAVEVSEAQARAEDVGDAEPDDAGCLTLDDAYERDEAQRSVDDSNDETSADRAFIAPSSPLSPVGDDARRVRKRVRRATATKQKKKRVADADRTRARKRSRLTTPSPAGDGDDDDDDDGDDFAGGGFATDKVKETLLARRYPVREFDGRIALEEPDHVYVIDGERNDARAHFYHACTPGSAPPYVSSTALVHECFVEFDALRTSERMVRSHRWLRSPYRADAEEHARAEVARCWTPDDLCAYLHEPPVRGAAATAAPGDMAHAALRAYFWRRGGCVSLDSLYGALEREEPRRALRDDLLRPLYRAAICADFVRANRAGTAMHDVLERHLDGSGREPRAALEVRAADGAREYAHALRWLDEWPAPRGLRPFRMELRVFDAEARVCGSLDALFSADDGASGDLVMVDWKGVRNMTAEPGTLVSAEWMREHDIEPPLYALARGTVPLDTLPDANFYHYVMQQNLYAYMLERGTGGRLRVREMYLAVFTPRRDSYVVWPVPRLERETAALYARRLAYVRACAAEAAAAL